MSAAKNRDIISKLQADPKTKQAMEVMQLTERSFRLLSLFPVIYVAWADGILQEEEITKILEIANEQGLSQLDGSGLLKVWLDPAKRPSQDFFVSGLRLTSAVLRHTKEDYKGNLLRLCEAVAESAGGVGGLGSVSPEEKQVIQQVAQQLGIGNEKSYDLLMKKMREELSPSELEWKPSQVSPLWIGINALVSVLITGGIFAGFWLLYPSFVVTARHMTIFLVLGLILPQVGFFVGSMLTARLSPGNTAKEGVIGTAIAIVAAMIVGAFFLGVTTRKYAGYNVVQPERVVYPQCDGLKFSNQACIRLETRRKETVCRLAKDAKAALSGRLGRQGRNWFASADCEGKATKEDFFLPGTKEPKLFEVKTRPERLLSKGYYPLCSEIDDPDRRCLMIVSPEDPKKAQCRVVPNLKADPTTLPPGKLFQDLFPSAYCRPVYARIYRIWKKEEGQSKFAGYLPFCRDIYVANQECVYLIRHQVKPGAAKQRVCLVSDSPTTPPSAITPAAAAYENWYPTDECKTMESGTPISIMLSGLAFALLAFFMSYFGGWVGERWQGTI